MGYTSWSASHYKRGRIDRVAEITSNLTTTYGDNAKQTVLKIAQVGSTLYSAVRKTDASGGETVIGVVTATWTKDGEIGAKHVTEFEGPYQIACPESILKLLSPTESELAREWRGKCHAYNAHIKQLRTAPEHAKLTIELVPGVALDYVKRCGKWHLMNEKFLTGIVTNRCASLPLLAEKMKTYKLGVTNFVIVY